MPRRTTTSACSTRARACTTRPSRNFSGPRSSIPRYDKAHNNLGVALLRSGKTDAAIVEFRGIVSRDPRNVDALTNLALALKAAGRAEEAREMLQRVLTINGRYPQAHYNLALIYEERGEWQRAIEHFEQFLANAGAESAALTVDVRSRVQALRVKLQ